MKRSAVWVCLLCFAIALVVDIYLLQQASSAAAVVNPAIAAKAAVLLNEKTGKIIFSKAESRRMYPASLTKLMTALLAAEMGDWQDEVVVGHEVNYVHRQASVAGLRVGDRLTLGELVWGMLLPSGNDAAYVTAVYIGRQRGGQHLPPDKAVRICVQLMNARAGQLGAKRTRFVNPDGFHHRYHYSTAYDLALIAQAAYQHPQLQPIFSTTEHQAQIRQAEQMCPKEWRNTNELIDTDSRWYYQWATGLKTGTTPQAGACLAAAAVKGEERLIAVVLQSTQDGRYQDAVALLEYGFQAGQAFTPALRQAVAELVAIDRWQGQKQVWLVQPQVAPAIELPAQQLEQLKQVIVWNRTYVARTPSGKLRLRQAVPDGADLGRLSWQVAGEEVMSVPLRLGQSRQTVLLRPWVSSLPLWPCKLLSWIAT